MSQKANRFTTTIRIITIILVITFIAQGVSWANPDIFKDKPIDKNSVPILSMSKDKLAITGLQNEETLYRLRTVLIRKQNELLSPSAAGKIEAKGQEIILSNVKDGSGLIIKYTIEVRGKFLWIEGNTLRGGLDGKDILGDFSLAIKPYDKLIISIYRPIGLIGSDAWRENHDKGISQTLLYWISDLAIERGVSKISIDTRKLFNMHIFKKCFADTIRIGDKTYSLDYESICKIFDNAIVGRMVIYDSSTGQKTGTIRLKHTGRAKNEYNIMESDNDLLAAGDVVLIDRNFIYKNGSAICIIGLLAEHILVEFYGAPRGQIVRADEAMDRKITNDDNRQISADAAASETPSKLPGHVRMTGEAAPLVGYGTRFYKTPESWIKGRKQESSSPLTTDSKILSAIDALKSRTKAITQKAIAKEAGLSKNTITRRKNSNRAIREAIESALLSFKDQKMLSAIDVLKSRKEAITQKTIAKEAGVAEATVKRRKRANLKIGKAIENALPLSMDSKILSAIDVLKSREEAITRRTIAKEAGLSDGTITRRKNANPAIEEAVESALLSPTDLKILSAIDALKSRKEAITRRTIAKEAGLSDGTITKRKNANSAIREAIENALPLSTDSKILSAIDALKSRKEAITQRTIAKEAGLDDNTITRRKNANPAIKEAIESALLSPTDLKILSAIDALKSREEAITQRIIAKNAEISETTVKNRKKANPAIKEAIENLSTDSRILSAIDALKPHKEAITQKAIAKEAGLSETTLTNRKKANPSIRKAILQAKYSGLSVIVAAYQDYKTSEGVAGSHRLVAKTIPLSPPAAAIRKELKAAIARTLQELSRKERRLVDQIIEVLGREDLNYDIPLEESLSAVLNVDAANIKRVMEKMRNSPHLGEYSNEASIKFPGHVRITDEAAPLVGYGTRFYKTPEYRIKGRQQEPVIRNKSIITTAPMQGTYADMDDFSRRHAVNTLGKTLDEIIERELSSALYALEKIKEIRDWMDINGSLDKPLIIWQNVRLGELYPCFTPRTKEAMGIEEIDLQDIREIIARGEPIPDSIKNARYVLVKGSLSSTFTNDTEVVTDGITDRAVEPWGAMEIIYLKNKTTSPVVMIDHSRKETSGAQEGIAEYEAQGGCGVIKINKNQDVDLRGKNRIFEQKSFFILLNPNQNLLTSESLFDDKDLFFDRTKSGQVIIAGREWYFYDAFRFVYREAIDGSIISAQPDTVVLKNHSPPKEGIDSEELTYKTIAEEARQFIANNKKVFLDNGLHITSCLGHSFEVKRMLAREGIESELFLWVNKIPGMYHVWVETRDGYIIDTYPMDGRAPVIKRISDDVMGEYKGDHINDRPTLLEELAKWNKGAEDLEKTYAMAAQPIVPMQTETVSDALGADIDNTGMLAVLLANLYEDDPEKIVYTIRLNSSKIPGNYIELIKGHYAKILSGRSNNVEVKVLGNDKLKGLVDVTVEICGRFQGNGMVNVSGGDGQAESLGRLIGMVNLAISVATIPEEFTDSGMDKYRGFLNIIAAQYELLTGERLELPEDPKNVSAFIHDMVMNLPQIKPCGVKPQEEFELMKKRLESAA